jgi:hypothetical protein
MRKRFIQHDTANSWQSVILPNISGCMKELPILTSAGGEPIG